MKEYLNLLVMQYMQATGTKNIDINSESFRNEFIDWLKERQRISDNYLNLLWHMNLSKIGDFETIEIGKGKYDSIVSPCENNYIISPFASTFNIGEERLITGDFRVESNKPFLITPDKKIRPIIDTYLTFMTQNPYTPNKIKNWEQLHNSSLYDIIVGVYGSINDKDKQSKLNEINDLRLAIEDNLEHEYTEINGSYCYVVASKRKVKKLVKTRHR